MHGGRRRRKGKSPSPGGSTRSIRRSQKGGSGRGLPQITADHGMNRKRRCWDLARALFGRGRSREVCPSPRADYTSSINRNFAGSAWVWINGPLTL